MSDAPDAVLRIAVGLDLVIVSANEVLVQFGSHSYPSQLIRDTDLTGLLGRVVGRLLEGPARASELIERGDTNRWQETRSVLADLLERGILTELDKSPTDQYLAYTFTGHSPLSRRSVSLLGAGPLGVRITQSLVQHGFGRIALLDDRVTDELWDTFTVGRARDTGHGPAHAILRDQLVAAGHPEVEALDVALDLSGITAAVRAGDLTIVAFEQPSPRLCHLVNRVCIRERKPWLLATVDGNRGSVGPLFVPPDTPCYNDYRTLLNAATPSPEIATYYARYSSQRPLTSFFPGLPAHADVVGGLASLAAVHFLVGDTSFALARVVTVDFERMIIDAEDVLKLPRCPVCGLQRSAYQPAFSAEVVTRAPLMKVEK